MFIQHIKGREDIIRTVISRDIYIILQPKIKRIKKKERKREVKWTRCFSNYHTIKKGKSFKKKYLA
jgi:hypothetical protein